MPMHNPFQKSCHLCLESVENHLKFLDDNNNNNNNNQKC